jgi:opacity protein-like surface antigen
MKSRWLVFSLVVVILAVVDNGAAQTRVGKLGVGISGLGGMLSSTDRTDASLGFGGGVSVMYSAMEYVGIRMLAGFQQLPFKDGGFTSNANVFSMNGSVSFDMIPNGTVNPFLLAGVGYSMANPVQANLVPYAVSGETKSITYNMGGGIDYFVNEFWSVTAQGEYVMTNIRNFDGKPDNGNSDTYLRIGLQVRYYFFDQAFIAKLLEAQSGRYKK